jgi:hypothetical protein
MADPKFSEEELRRMAKSWFSEAREKSAQDDAEVSVWKKEIRKWTHSTDSGSGGWFSSDSGDSGGGGDGGGGGD